MAGDEKVAIPANGDAETSALASSRSSGLGKEEQTAKDSAKTPKTSFSLPPWVTTNLKSGKAWKTLARCIFATWVAYVLLLPQASLNVLGTAAFFTILASVFLPPMFPVQLFLFLISTLVIGLCLGWGIGAAAMRAGVAVRDQGRLSAAYSALQGSEYYQSDPVTATTVAIFGGDFLDVRTSAVYGCFLGFGVFVFSAMRAYAPKLVFLSIFGMIAVDVFCTIGPLFPTSRYTLLNSFLISVGCYAGIGVIATIFIFPSTMSHDTLHAIDRLFTKITALIEVQEEVFATSPKDLASGSALSSRIVGDRSAAIAGIQQMSATASFLSLEFTWGRWNGDDVKELIEHLTALIARIAGLQTFARIVGESHAVRERILAPVEETKKHKTGESSETSTLASHGEDSYVLRHYHERNRQSEIENAVSTGDLMPILRDCSQNLREATIAATKAAQAYLSHINTKRWRGKNTERQLSEALDEAQVHLQDTLEKFKSDDRLALLGPYKDLLSAVKTRAEAETLPLRSLYSCYVFAANLISTSQSTSSLLVYIQSTAARRTRNRLWAPTGLRAIGKLFTHQGDQSDNVFGEESQPIPQDDNPIDAQHRRDPDSRPPTNVFQKFMNAIHHVYRWSKSPEALFCFKTAIVTVALWFPAVVPNTASFFYTEKGLWALIMAQTTMNVYSSDQMFNLIFRLAGTFVGLILGLLTWYIGNAKSNGSPYGSAAAVAVFCVPVLFLRLHAPPQYSPAIILAGATWVLIVGYSWVDGHLPQYGNPGIGWTVAWKRFVLVVIGSGASFFMMLLPPQSSRKAVRRRNAALIGVFGRLYSFLVSTWIDSAAGVKVTSAQKEKKWTKDFRSRLVMLASEVNTLRGMTSLATWEGNLRGAWPVDQYMKLVDLQMAMVNSLAQMGGALNSLDDEWLQSLVHNTRVLNPHFISDVMSVFMSVSQSLNTGEPVHQVVHSSLIERLFYHHHKHRHHHDSRDAGDKASKEADAVSKDIARLSSLEFLYYATAIIAIYELLKHLDELHAVTRELCGEVPMRGFAEWQQDFERMHREDSS